MKEVEKTTVEQPNIPISEKAQARFKDVISQVKQAETAFRSTVEKYNTFVYGLGVGLDVDMESYVFDEETMAFHPKPEPVAEKPERTEE